MRQLVSFPDKIQICNKIKVLILDHLVFFAREISSLGGADKILD